MLLTPKHPLLHLSMEFFELCWPLELFHINHFTYQKQFNDGTRISLSNKAQWIEDYYNLDLYKSSLFEQKPGEYKPEFNVWFGEYNLDVYRHGRLYYDTAHSITVTEPKNNGCEHYLFSAAPENKQAIQYLADNRDIIYHFILYLKDRGEALLKKAIKNKIIIPKSFISAENPTYRNIQNYNQNLQAAKNFFLDKTPIYHYLFESAEGKEIRLTPREISCITHLLNDKTAAETAKLMNISRRTAESYLEKIKIKLNCATKAELIKKLKCDRFLFALKSHQ